MGITAATAALGLALDLASAVAILTTASTALGSRTETPATSAGSGAATPAALAGAILAALAVVTWAALAAATLAAGEADTSANTSFASPSASGGLRAAR